VRQVVDLFEARLIDIRPAAPGSQDRDSGNGSNEDQEP
jgi:hypothetical protein